MCYVGDGDDGPLGYVNALNSIEESRSRCAQLLELMQWIENSRQASELERINERDALLAHFYLE